MTGSKIQEKLDEKGISYGISHYLNVASEKTQAVGGIIYEKSS